MLAQKEENVKIECTSGKENQVLESQFCAQKNSKTIGAIFCYLV